MIELEAYHAGRGTGGSSTDHEVRDLVAPVTLALSVGQQRQGSLLQEGRGVRSWNKRKTRFNMNMSFSRSYGPNTTYQITR